MAILLMSAGLAKPPLACMWLEGLAQPAIVPAATMAVSATVARSVFDMARPLFFLFTRPLDRCPFGHRFEFRHGREELIKRPRDELLSGLAGDGAGQPQLEVTRRVEPERECGLALDRWLG